MSSDGISSEDGLSAATQTVLYSLGASLEFQPDAPHSAAGKSSPVTLHIYAPATVPSCVHSLYYAGAFFALTAAWAALLVGRLLWSFIPQSRHIDSQQEIASSSETDASSERYACTRNNFNMRAHIEEAVHMAVRTCVGRHAAAKGVGMKQLLKESKSKQRGHVVTAPGSAHRLCINTLKVSFAAALTESLNR